MDMYGYTPYFNQPDPKAKVIEGFMDKFNKQNLEKAIKQSKMLKKDRDTIYMNYAPLLIRRKTEEFPQGRTSHRFKARMRNNITIIDKSKPKPAAPEYVNKTFSFADFKKKKLEKKKEEEEKKES